MRRFFISTPPDDTDQVILTADEAHHLRDILRLKCGQSIMLLDGCGHRFQAEIESISQTQVITRIVTPLDGDPSDAPIEITLAQAFLKENKIDRLIAPLTELGISKLVAFCAERSVARPNAAKQPRRIQRWQKIAREAIKQCGRHHLPILDWAPSFDAMLKDCAHDDVRLIFWENETRLLAHAAIPSPRPHRITAIVGPEGGLAESEIDLACQYGFIPLSLGPRILRAHTAALAVTTVLQYQFGDLGTPAPRPKCGLTKK